MRLQLIGLLLVGCVPVKAPELQKVAEKTYSACDCSWSNETDISKSIFKSAWTKRGLDPELGPIAWNESYNNTNLEHVPNANGPFQTAFGPLGIKPSTGHLEWLASPKMKKEYPGLEKPMSFLIKFRTDVLFYNKVSSNHWWRLKQLANGDKVRAAFGWRYGPAMIESATEAQLVSDTYTFNYAKRASVLIAESL